MRSAGLAIAAFGVAALGLTLPGTAQAAPSGGTTATDATVAATNYCPGKRDDWKDDGNFRAYDAIYCDSTGFLGIASGNDQNWGDSSGDFQGTDTNRATSLINTGTYSSGWNIVKFYDATNTSGAHLCLGRNDYIDNLYYDRNGNRQTYSSGTASASNSISSH